MMAKMLSIIFIVFISGSATANGDINNDIVRHEPEMSTVGNSTLRDRGHGGRKSSEGERGDGRNIGNSTLKERGDGRNIPIFNVISFPNRLNHQLRR